MNLSLVPSKVGTLMMIDQRLILIDLSNSHLGTIKWALKLSDLVLQICGFLFEGSFGLHVRASPRQHHKASVRAVLSFSTSTIRVCLQVHL
jgi:hypothetical protein